MKRQAVKAAKAVDDLAVLVKKLKEDTLDSILHAISDQLKTDVVFLINRK